MIQGMHDHQTPREIDSGTGLPIGPRIDDPDPAKAPERIVLEGRYARLEPLDAGRHGDNLHAASTLPDRSARFRYMPEFPPGARESFDVWLSDAAASPDPLFFAVIDRATGPGRRLADVPAHHARPPVHRDRQHLLGAAHRGHPGRHRGDVPVRRLRAGVPRVPPLRMEVRCAQRPVAPGRAAVRIHVRRPLSPCGDHSRPQSRHLLVLHHRRGVAGPEGGVRAMGLHRRTSTRRDGRRRG